MYLRETPFFFFLYSLGIKRTGNSSCIMQPCFVLFFFCSFTQIHASNRIQPGGKKKGGRKKKTKKKKVAFSVNGTQPSAKNWEKREK